MKQVSAFLILGSVFLSGPRAHGMESVQQERFHENGVWVSRPRASDAAVSDLIDAHRFRTVEEYLHWLQGSFQYRPDTGGDRWASPDQTLRDRAGDCEDYAFLNRTVLKFLGYDAKVIAMESDTDGHAVCVFLEKGHYSVLDNRRLIRTDATRFEDLVRRLTKTYKMPKWGLLDLPTRRPYAV